MDALSKTNLNKENGYVDGVKIIMALFVVCIHTNPLLSYSEEANFWLTEGLCRIAVPVFFVYAGLFLCNNIKSKGSKTVVSYVKRVLRMYTVWSILYLPIAIITYYRTEGKIDKVVAFKLIRDFLFVGFKQYWYLLALAVGVCIVAFLYRKLGIKRTLVICAALYVVSLLGNGYYGLYSNLADQIPLLGKICSALAHILVTTRNGFFFAPFGFFISENEFSIKHPVVFVSVFAVVRWLEMLFAKNNHLAKGYAMMLSLIPISVIIVLWSLQKKSDNGNSKISWYLRKLSTLIYVTHTIVCFIVEPFISNTLLLFICVSLVSLVISLCLIKLSSKIKCLRYLC